jgi:hypothetical protein
MFKSCRIRLWRIKGISIIFQIKAISENFRAALFESAISNRFDIKKDIHGACFSWLMLPSQKIA